ncbi:type VII secretion protein [[Mycobacterium] chelonae subsp. bovistauri]|nr:type VII secretion protein [Mycobacterium sp. QIA-37]
MLYATDGFDKEPMLRGAAMPAQVTTRAQVNGYRFLLRRLEHALIRADSRMIHDPMRGQIRSLMVGFVFAILITGAATVLAFFKPMPNIGNAQILISKSSGGMFVQIGDRVHPVLNISSARMITGSADAPKQVDDRFLNQLPRGPMVGIVGAPAAIHGADNLDMSSWTVCDSVTTPDIRSGPGPGGLETAVLANDPVLGNGIRAASAAEMLLVMSGDTVYLVYDGVRAAVDPRDRGVVNALHLQDVYPRPVSPGLLNSFPLVPPIRPVVVEGIGEPAPYLPDQYPVGSMIKTSDSTGNQLYVVLRDGLQRISDATADIIRYGGPANDPQGTHEVSPSLVSNAPIVHTLPVDHYPTVSPRIIDLEPDRVACMSWQRAKNAAQATIRLLVGHQLPLPSGAKPVPLASSDGTGPGVDWVYLKPGTGEFVEATGNTPESRAAGALFYVADTGLRYHIKDLPTAAALGVSGVTEPNSDAMYPQLAPWSVLSLLPAGPELSQEAALVAHDSLAADPAGTKVDPPKQ